MNKKLLKKIIFCVIIMANISSFVFASAYVPSSVTPTLSGVGGAGNVISNMAVGIIGAMMWIGYAISIGAVLIIGVKYTMAAADEKASIKGMLVKVFIGSCIMFLASMIVNVAISIFTVE